VLAMPPRKLQMMLLPRPMQQLPMPAELSNAPARICRNKL
jgi:hypothetical protein